MGRRKKEIIEEKPVEMVENAMNEPVQTEDLVESVSEEVTEEVPTVEVPVVDDFVEAEITEAPVEDITSSNIEKEPVFKKIQCGASLVNVREKPDGDVLFTIRNLSKVRVEGEENGWVKISGYVMADLVKDL